MPALHRFLIPLALLLGLHGAAQAAICRVATSGNATADGSNWDQATTLQGALGNANCDEIWVQQGLYKPTTDTNRTVSFAINRPLKLYGGFIGQETALAERSGDSSSTTLSGDIRTEGDSSDNSHHVLVIGGTGATGNGSYTSADTVVDGFTVTAGRANGGGFNNYGGGLYCNGLGAGKVCSPLLTGLVFQGNAATFGGAIYNSGNSGGSSSPAITNTTFSGNSANSGGAVYNNGNSGGSSSPAITNTTFNGNSATYGGAIYNDGYSGSSSPAITNATFSGNSAVTGGAILSYGGSGSSSPAITNTTFSGNSAATGGAIYTAGFDSTSRPSVTRSVFWGNTAGSDGAQASTDGNAQITFNNSLIQGGCASGGTGGGTCSGPLLTADPLLGPLQNNGGPTPTMLPAANSPVIDAGGACTGSDQRGVARPQGGACDLGAVERRQGNYTLDVAVTGAGSVSAGAAPVPAVDSITNCTAAGGAACTAGYAIDSTPAASVTLTATPDAGQTFSGWGGACTGTGTCTVAMDQARSVTAGFVLSDFSGGLPGGGTATALLAGGGAGCTLVPGNTGFASPASTPPGVSFPQGVFAFSASGCTAGSSVMLTLSYPQPLPAGAQYWKFGPTAANATAHWFVLPGATINGNTVTFSITDNGDGDSDPAPGSITDPGGVGVLAVAAGGVTAIPVDAPWMLGLLTLLLGGAAWRAKRVGYRQGQGHSLIDS
ncbi:choice-of-anchor U domain-containing protein [Xylophilus sp. GW821-FHT01B05]